MPYLCFYESKYLAQILFFSLYLLCAFKKSVVIYDISSVPQGVNILLKFCWQISCLLMYKVYHILLIVYHLTD